MIEVTKTYRLVEFREDLKNLYRQCGVANKPTTFLFNDTQAGASECPLWLPLALRCSRV
jgi:hypothetical protein